MAADPYTGIVAMWIDDVPEGAEFHRLLSEMRRPPVRGPDTAGLPGGRHSRQVEQMGGQRAVPAE